MKITLAAICFLTLFLSSSLLFADAAAEVGIITKVNARGSKSGQPGFVAVTMPSGKVFILEDASNQYNKIVYAAILSAYVNKTPVYICTENGTEATAITQIVLVP